MGGGRRILFEILHHLGLSQEGENRRAITRFEGMRWTGNSLELMATFLHTADEVCEGAVQAGITNDQIVGKLAQCFEHSADFRPTLETWMAMNRQPGQRDWRELLQRFAERVQLLRCRVQEAEATASVKANPSANGGGKSHAAPSLPVASPEPAAQVLQRLGRVCRQHAFGTCPRAGKCQFSHAPLSAVDRKALLEAMKEQMPQWLPRQYREDSPTAKTDAAAPRKCKYPLDKCQYGDRCRFIHDDTPEELRRALKAEEARSTPRNKPAAGVHAQFGMEESPDVIWANWGDSWTPELRPAAWRAER